MSVLKLYTYPDKILSTPCEEVKNITAETRKLLDDMLETMYADKGVGLAAPQIGLSLKMIVVDDKVGENGEAGPHPMKMVNPEIIEKSSETIFFNEGCLSLPGQCAEVERHAAIKVKYQDENGKEHILEASDYLAVILQHEIDHLSGILYIDHLSRLKRNMIIKKLLKQAQE